MTHDRTRLLLGLALVGTLLALAIGTPLRAQPMPMPDVFQFSVDPQSATGVFRQPEGIAIGPEGEVYIVDSENHRVQVFTADGEFVRTWGYLGTGDGELYFPKGLHVTAPDSASGPTVFVADMFNHRVGMFEYGGRYITTFRGQMFSPSDIAVGPEGALYVTDAALYHVEVFDPSGRYIESFGEQGEEPGQFQQPMSVAVSDDGVVYVTDALNNRLDAFDVSGVYSDTISAESGEAALEEPWGVAIGNDGVIYVADAGNDRVARYGPDGEWLGAWGDRGREEGQLITPIAVAVAPDGTIYVLERGGERVQRFDAEGNVISTFGQPANDQLYGISDVAVADDGTMYLPDSDRLWPALVEDMGDEDIAPQYPHRIVELAADGLKQATFGQFGAGEGQFRLPEQIALAPDGSLFVTDSYGDKVLHFGADGTHLGTPVTSGRGEGEVEEPFGVSVAQDGTLFVTDRADGRVQAWSADGTFLQAWGSTGSAAEQLRNPRGVAVAEPDDVYVVDGSPLDPDQVEQWAEVKRYTREGTLQSSWGTIGSEPGMLETPVDVTHAPDGTVYVSDFGNERVERYDADGAHLGTIGGQGVEAGQFRWPGGIDIGPDGRLYIADGMSRLHVFGAARADAWRVELFDNPWLADWPAVVTDTREIDLDWGEAAPADGVPADGWSARMTWLLPFSEEDFYEVELEAEGGVRLWVGNRLELEDWDAEQTDFSTSLLLEERDYLVRLEFRDNGGPASLRFALTGPTLPLPTATPEPEPGPVYLPRLLKGVDAGR